MHSAFSCPYTRMEYDPCTRRLATTPCCSSVCAQKRHTAWNRPVWDIVPRRHHTEGRRHQTGTIYTWFGHFSDTDIRELQEILEWIVGFCDFEWIPIPVLWITCFFFVIMKMVLLSYYQFNYLMVEIHGVLRYFLYSLMCFISHPRRPHSAHFPGRSLARFSRGSPGGLVLPDEHRIDGAHKGRHARAWCRANCGDVFAPQRPLSARTGVIY